MNQYPAQYQAQYHREYQRDSIKSPRIDYEKPRTDDSALRLAAFLSNNVNPIKSVSISSILGARILSSAIDIKDEEGEHDIEGMESERDARHGIERAIKLRMLSSASWRMENKHRYQGGGEGGGKAKDEGATKNHQQLSRIGFHQHHPTKGTGFKDATARYNSASRTMRQDSITSIAEFRGRSNGSIIK